VGWLLTPSKGHRLGEVPLRSLLLLAAQSARVKNQNPAISAVDACTFDLSECRVQTEVAFENGQIDILLELPKESFALIIENKIDAKEGADQLKRYAEWAKEYYEQKEWRYALLFLTLHGRLPIGSKGFIPVSYNSWIPELEKFFPATLEEEVVTSQFIANMKEILNMDEPTNKLNEACLKLWSKYPDALEELSMHNPNENKVLSEAVANALEKEFDDYEVDQKTNHVNIIPLNSELHKAYPGICYSISFNYPKIGYIVGLGITSDSNQADDVIEALRPQLDDETFRIANDSGPSKKYGWICYFKPDALSDVSNDKNVLTADNAHEASYKAENWNEIIKALVKATKKIIDKLPPEKIRDALRDF
jgi:hypothetical protein